MPICLAGSKITSDQILADFGMVSPWNEKREEATATIARTAVKTLDIDRWGSNSQLLGVIVAFFLAAAMASFQSGVTKLALF